MNAVCIEITQTGERLLIPDPVWVRITKNGILRAPDRAVAQGICDGETTWSLGSLEGYPEAKIITRAEYEEKLAQPDPDPELTDREALSIILGGTYEDE